MSSLSDRKRRWGIILAGGDGVRLRPLTRLICGDDRPKQYCPLYGGMTLLEQARRRAQRSIRAEQMLFSLNRAHEDFYLRELVDCPSQRVVQPRNRGTVPAILSSLLLIARRDQNATVAVFPSDHYYSDENVIAEAVENAFALSRWEPDSVILVGAYPHSAEVEYGWIELGESTQGRPGAFRVRGFYEKPSPALARLLLEQGSPARRSPPASLWNTFVMVGKALAFLEIIGSSLPGVLAMFQPFSALPAPNEELRIHDSVYANIPSFDFSRHVLATETPRLMAQQLGPVTWSDLGDCDRTVAALWRCGPEPKWATRWRAAQSPPTVVRASAAAVSA
jgi:mannose-1-phosphate guanylyltransferase